ncbi:MAG: putative DNA-binding domain-containing protein [Xanthomonadaceae bacterium]|nr:putative DNA-binding domain-containing protein [Xanthomonadaceae bacterium]MDE1964869.1 putative DNA-binding domain-containing protein [Xanthomonadaceae bacterium]
MHVVPALLELQSRFLDALYDDAEAGPTEALVGAGLDPAARLRIYRHAAAQIHADALRATYPALLALVGEAFFEQVGVHYRRAHPSRSGNLQAFGAHFADFLESLQATGTLPYLGDVARLEWQRQQAALAGTAEALSAGVVGEAFAGVDGAVRIALHPSVRRFASPHPVLSIWQYAMQPSPGRLTLPEHGDRLLLWRSEAEVAMAPIDAASFACIGALLCGVTLDAAHAAARAKDSAFDLPACITSLVAQELVVAITPVHRKEHPACA